MYLSGMSFFVLADHFLAHQSHVYEAAARRLEVRSCIACDPLSDAHASFEARKQSQDLSGLYGRNLPPVSTPSANLPLPSYSKRYLRQHRDVNTTMGHNVIEECKKLKGVPITAAYVRLFQFITEVFPTSVQIVDGKV